MPLYNTATAAAAVGASRKWIDNLLSHNKIEGAVGGTQGVSRRLSMDAVRVIALAKEFNDALHVPIPNAIEIASALLASPSNEVRPSALLTLVADRASLEQQLLTRLEHAVEVTPARKRGRPTTGLRSSRNTDR